MRWGLIPVWWKKSAKETPATVNARAESVADKPMFRTAFRKQRAPFRSAASMNGPAKKVTGSRTYPLRPTILPFSASPGFGTAGGMTVRISVLHDHFSHGR
jgi:hypothetical protein